MRRKSQWTRFVVMPLAMAIIGRICLAGWGQTLPSDLPMALAERLNAQMSRGHVSLLLDASGSMSGRYAVVRAAALKFAEGLARGETLTARAFAANITQPIYANGGEARSLLERGLPHQPMAGTGTDLGLALSKALDDLDRPDAAPVQALFVLTDGLHQPPPDSPYGRDFATDPDWIELRKKATALAKRFTLIVYGLGIGAETDIGVLRQVFPARNVEILSGDTAAAGAVLQNLHRQLRLIRLKQVLHEDLEKGKVVIAVVSRTLDTRRLSANVTLEIGNHYRALPVTLRNLRIQSLEPYKAKTTSSAPTTLRLRPGEKATYSLTTQFAAHLPRWKLGRHIRHFRTTYKITCASVFDDAEALNELGLNASPTVAQSKAAVVMDVQYGKPWWLVICVAASAALSLIGWKRRLTVRPVGNLQGTIVIEGRPISLSTFNKERVSVGPDGADVPLPGLGRDKGALELYTEADGDYAQLALDTKGNLVTINGVSVLGKRLLSAGDTVTLREFQFAVLENGRFQTRMWHPLRFAIPAVLLLVTFAMLLLMP